MSSAEDATRPLSSSATPRPSLPAITAKTSSVSPPAASANSLREAPSKSKHDDDVYTLIQSEPQKLSYISSFIKMALIIPQKEREGILGYILTFYPFSGGDGSCGAVEQVIVLEYILIYQQNMPFQLAAKKAGLSLVRGFLHSIEGLRPAVGEAVQKRNSISYKFKTYRDGKVANIAVVETLEDAFPCRGDKK